MLLVLLTVRITFSLIHGCRRRMSHVIVVAVGSVKLLLASSSSSSLFLSHSHPIFPSVSHPLKRSFLLLLAAVMIVMFKRLLLIN